MTMPTSLFRLALLLLLTCAIALAAWHIAWLHGQPPRYQLQVTERGNVFILDTERQVVYVGSGFFDDSKPVEWHTSPLPVSK